MVQMVTRLADDVGAVLTADHLVVSVNASTSATVTSNRFTRGWLDHTCSDVLLQLHSMLRCRGFGSPVDESSAFQKPRCLVSTVGLGKVAWRHCLVGPTRTTSVQKTDSGVHG